MSGKLWRNSRVAAAAVVALWAGAAFATAPAGGGAEASIPQARARIFNYALDGHKGIWIQTVGDQWYYGEFLSPCFGALPDQIAFTFNPDGSVNRFSKVLVPRAHLVCAFTTFIASAGPAAAPSQEGR